MGIYTTYRDIIYAKGDNYTKIEDIPFIMSPDNDDKMELPSSSIHIGTTVEQLTSRMGSIFKPSIDTECKGCGHSTHDIKCVYCGNIKGEW